MSLSQILLTLLIIASWGSNAAVSKIGIMELEPIAFLAIRFFFTALIFVPFGRVHKKDLKLLLIISLLLNVGHMGSCFVAYKFLMPSSAMVLQQSQVPFALITAALFAGEKITKMQIGGILLAIGGVMFIFGLPELNLVGAFFALSGSLFWAFTQLALKKSKSIDAPTFMGYTALFSFPFLTLESFIFENGIWEKFLNADKLRFYSSLSYEVLAMAAAMMLWQVLIKKNGISKLAPFTLLQVLFGILSGVVFFNETLNSQTIFGATLTIFGVMLTMLSAKHFRWLKKKNNAEDLAVRQTA